MSDQPTFRHRVLPMPKVEDKIISIGGELSEVDSIDNHLDGYVWIKTRFGGVVLVEWAKAGHLNFADPAVEAQRLMEAAYRADTSPPPEWLVENTKYAKDVTEVIDNIFADCMTTCGCYERGDKVDERKAIKAIAEALPFLARWQAQQEGGSHE